MIVRPVGSARSRASITQFFLIQNLPMSIDPEQFIQASMAGLFELTAAHDGAWGIGHIARWDADLESGQLVFTLDDGTTATAPMQIVGTYDTENGTFLWAWDNPSLPERLKSAAELARKWGEENDQQFYSSPGIKCPEEQAWEFAAVTTRLAGANGAYRGPSGATHIFMTFGEVTLSKPTA